MKILLLDTYNSFRHFTFGEKSYYLANSKFFYTLDFLLSFYLYFGGICTVTMNSFNNGKYDGNFIDQRIPRLLPVLSEFESKLFPITKALKKRYFTNIDIDNEDDFRPRYVEVSLLSINYPLWSSILFN